MLLCVFIRRTRKAYVCVTQPRLVGGAAYLELDLPALRKGGLHRVAVPLPVLVHGGGHGRIHIVGVVKGNRPLGDHPNAGLGVLKGLAEEERRVLSQVSKAPHRRVLPPEQPHLDQRLHPI